MPDQQQLDLSAFEVCVTCGRLRGGSPREHRCRCQPHTAEWQQQWQGRDMAQDLDMCVLCVRGTVTTYSKWSWLGCETCRDVSDVVGSWHGVRRALPLGRHSIMNAAGMQPVPTTDAEVREVADALQASLRSWDSLYAWRDAEFDRLAGPVRTGGLTVPLVEWQRRWPPSLGASVDAFERYVGAPVPDRLTRLLRARDAFRSS